MQFKCCNSALVNKVQISLIRLFYITGTLRQSFQVYSGIAKIGGDSVPEKIFQKKFS